MEERCREGRKEAFGSEKPPRAHCCPSRQEHGWMSRCQLFLVRRDELAGKSDRGSGSNRLGTGCLGVSEGSWETAIQMGGHDILAAISRMPAGIKLLNCHSMSSLCSPKTSCQGLVHSQVASLGVDRMTRPLRYPWLTVGRLLI